MKKNCKFCKQFFEKPYYISKKNWAERKYCSKPCADKARIGTLAWNKGKKLHYTVWNKDKKGLQVAWNKGQGDYAKKLGFGKWMQGKDLRELSGNWKGDNVGYVALHDWVRRRLGRPTKCEHCGFVSENTRQFHWANKSTEYKRDLNDWVRLCAKCHKIFDKGRKQKRFKIP